MMSLRSSYLAAGLAALTCCAVLAGCGDLASTARTVASSQAIAGNWSFAAAATPASASQIATLAGSLQVTGGAVAGTVHTVALGAQTAKALCVTPSQSVAVTGTTAADGTLTLTSGSFGGQGVLTIQGTFDTASRTLKNATFQIAGGSCAVAVQPMVATQYQPISGTYNGTFVSDGGGSLAVSAMLNQTSAADANGNFTLSGTGTFAQNPCLVSPVVSSSTVTGNNVSWTYTDSQTGATVTASGTFNNDATVLTVGSYVLSGGPSGCADTGHGTLTK